MLVPDVCHHNGNEGAHGQNSAQDNIALQSHLYVSATAKGVTEAAYHPYQDNGERDPEEQRTHEAHDLEQVFCFLHVITFSRRYASYAHGIGPFPPILQEN